MAPARLYPIIYFTVTIFIYFIYKSVIWRLFNPWFISNIMCLTVLLSANSFIFLTNGRVRKAILDLRGKIMMNHEMDEYYLRIMEVWLKSDEEIVITFIYINVFY